MRISDWSSDVCSSDLLHRLYPFAHQRAERRRRGVEDVHLVLVADLPEAREVGIVRHAFEHQRRRAVGERPIDDVAVAGAPADKIGRASCRERVCQYVTLSGVAGSFKNKTTQYT